MKKQFTYELVTDTAYGTRRDWFSTRKEARAAFKAVWTGNTAQLIQITTTRKTIDKKKI